MFWKMLFSPGSIAAFTVHICVGFGLFGSVDETEYSRFIYIAGCIASGIHGLALVAIGISICRHKSNLQKQGRELPSGSDAGPGSLCLLTGAGIWVASPLLWLIPILF